VSSLPAGLPEVSELVRALALGWKNLAAYPVGHPALVASLQRIQQRLDDIRGPAGEVVLGVAVDGIIYGQDKLVSTYAQKFAQALYTRGVAVARFDTATRLSDIETFLRLLGVGTGGGGDQTRPIWEELTAAGTTGINLQPVDYSAVQITDSLDATAPPRPEGSWLWDEILRALLADRELSPTARYLLSQEVRSINELAELMLRYADELTEAPVAFDPDATFGIRLAGASDAGDTGPIINDRLASAVGMSVGGTAGAKRHMALQQVVQLLRVLPEAMRGAVLRSVLRNVATDEAAGSQLRDFAADLPQDDVLDALRHLSTLTKLSSHAMSLLESLTAINAPVTAPPAIPPDVVSELVTLFGEDDIDRFNPPDHRALLDDVSVHVPSQPRSAVTASTPLGERAETVAEDALNRQLVRTLLDLLVSYGASRQTEGLLGRLETVFASQLTSGSFDDALTLIEEIQEIAIVTTSETLRTAVDQTYGRLSSPEMTQTLISSLLTAPPETVPTIHQLIAALGAAATRSLLTALAEENNRSRRRRLFDFVASLGTVIVPEVTKLLRDPRWFVVRNMIALLRAVDDYTSLPELQRLAQHPDLRVRLAAIKGLLSMDAKVPPGLLHDVINHADPKMAETAITLVGNYGIREGVDPRAGPQGAW
jgi:hypothetical protein